MEILILLLGAVIGSSGTAAVLILYFSIDKIRQEIEEFKRGKRQTQATDAAFLDIAANSISGRSELETIEGLIYTLAQRFNALGGTLDRISNISGEARGGPWDYGKNGNSNDPE